MGITKPSVSGKVQPLPVTGSIQAGAGTQGGARAGARARTQGTARVGPMRQPGKQGNAKIQDDKKQFQDQTRDPNGINDHVKVQFEDVIGEPEGVRTIDCCWTKSWYCYTCWKNVLYRLATLLCGFPLATIYGCCFAYTAFPHVWILTPFSKALVMCCQSFSRLQKQCIYCIIGSPCEHCGQIFSAFNHQGKKGPVGNGKRAGVTFDDKIKTRRIPPRNSVNPKEQQIARLQIVRQSPRR